MSFTIGRFGALPALSSVAVWNTSAEQVTVTGRYAGSVANAVALRGQLNGLLNNPDEPVVPVSWSADRTVDGFYRVLDGSYDMVGASLATGLFEFSCTLQRVAPVYACQVEAVVTGDVLPNDWSITTGRSWWGSPLPQVDRSISPWPATTIRDPRLTDTGYVYYYRCASTSDLNGTGSYWAPPAEYYQGACTILAAGVPVIGRACPPLQGFGGWSWEINNGLVKVAGDSVTGSFTVSTYDGTSWSTPISYKVFDMQAGVVFSPFYGTPTILRNTPECVSIRFLGPNSFNDLTIRRGSWLALGNVAFPPNSEVNTVPFHVATASTVSGTTFTGGVRWTDGSSYRVLYTGVDSTITTAGDITANATTAKSFDFGIGYIFGGSGASSLQTLAVQTTDYMTAIAVEEQVVPL